jgi:DNA-directed RNA polymerase specialized sigma24 family protein
VPAEALTVERLSVLLERMDPDVSEAGEKLLRLHQRLSTLFQYKGCAFPDELADRAIDILATRLTNTDVESVEAYLMAIAQNLVKKSWEKQKRLPLPLEVLGERAAPADDPLRVLEEEQTRGIRAACLEQCLSHLPGQARTFFLACHTGDKRQRIQSRTDWAQREGLSPVAVRVRLHRIRVALEKCVGGCLRRGGRRDHA